MFPFVSNLGLQTISFHITLTLPYDGWSVPKDARQSGDTRKLAVAMDWIRFTSDDML